jgi:dUTP pyrophosphatase
MKIKLLNNLAKVPTRGSADAAGLDLYAATDYNIIIEPHQTVKVDTGIAIAVPKNYFGGIFARSGLATKQGLRPANCVGVIDADYRGSVIVALHNDTDEPQTICAGDRIAQLILIPCSMEDIEVVEELDNTERGNDGFGSTGK